MTKKRKRKQTTTRHAPSLLRPKLELIWFIKDSIEHVDESDRRKIFETIWKAHFNRLCEFTYLHKGGELVGIQGDYKQTHGPDEGTLYTGSWHCDLNNSPEHELSRVTKHVCDVWSSVENFKVIRSFKGFSNSEPIKNKILLRYCGADCGQVIEFVQWLISGEIPTDRSEAIKQRESFELSYNSPKYKRQIENIQFEKFQNGKLHLWGLDQKQTERLELVSKLALIHW